MKCLKLIFLMIFFSKLVVAEEEKVSVEKREVWYQLQKQDSLGELLYGLGIGPLWGKHGFVAKTFHLNKDILPAPDTLPSAGTWIQLPVTQGWQSSTAQKKYANHLLYKVVEVKVHKQLKKQVQR